MCIIRFCRGSFVDILVAFPLTYCKTKTYTFKLKICISPVDCSYFGLLNKVYIHKYYFLIFPKNLFCCDSVLC